MLRVTVDRLEGKFAVCELPDGIIIRLVLEHLPEGTREGSVIDVEDDGTAVLNQDAMAERKEELLKLQNEVFTKND